MTRSIRFAWALFFGAVMIAAVVPRAVEAREPPLAEFWNGDQIAWQEIGPGIREATRSGKPVIMVFHASWCPSCKRYREVWKDPSVVAATRSFVMILIDVDKDPEANGAFSPDGTYVPRTLFLDSEGNVQSSIHGSDPDYPHSVDISKPDELLSLMQKAQKDLTGPDPAAVAGPSPIKAQSELLRAGGRPRL